MVVLRLARAGTHKAPFYHLGRYDAWKIGIRQTAGIVAGSGAILVLKSVIGGLDAVELGNDVARPCALDQFLAFQYTAQQQADHHQHDGELDQGEAAWFTIHEQWAVGGACCGLVQGRLGFSGVAVVFMPVCLHAINGPGYVALEINELAWLPVWGMVRLRQTCQSADLNDACRSGLPGSLSHSSSLNFV